MMSGINFFCIFLFAVQVGILANPFSFVQFIPLFLIPHHVSRHSHKQFIISLNNLYLNIYLFFFLLLSPPLPPGSEPLYVHIDFSRGLLSQIISFQSNLTCKTVHIYEPSQEKDSGIVENKPQNLIQTWIPLWEGTLEVVNWVACNGCAPPKCG